MDGWDGCVFSAANNRHRIIFGLCPSLSSRGSSGAMLRYPPLDQTNNPPFRLFPLGCVSVWCVFGSVSLCVKKQLPPPIDPSVFSSTSSSSSSPPSLTTPSLSLCVHTPLPPLRLLLATKIPLSGRVVVSLSLGRFRAPYVGAGYPRRHPQKNPSHHHHHHPTRRLPSRL
jgi:hypothetical protein